MNDITTNEFRDQIADLREPVVVRKYRTVIGRWYPAGTEPRSAELPEVRPDLLKVSDCGKKVIELEDEVARLKRLLAAKAEAVLVLPLKTVAQARKDEEDPFMDLPKQDREFFERRLGKGKRK